MRILITPVAQDLCFHGPVYLPPLHATAGLCAEVCAPALLSCTQNGMCHRGANCPYSHNMHEYFLVSTPGLPDTPSLDYFGDLRHSVVGEQLDPLHQHQLDTHARVLHVTSLASHMFLRHSNQTECSACCSAASCLPAYPAAVCLSVRCLYACCLYLLQSCIFAACRAALPPCCLACVLLLCYPTALPPC
jgi:hypothetical protein